MNQSLEHILHVGSPNTGCKEKFFKRVEGMFDRNWLTNRGPLVQEFEAELAAYLGVKYCITVCNGTVALEIAIRAMGLTGEVIIPSLTFIATAHALQWQEITPIFCDIDPKTYCINPAEIERHITSKTSGILGVHLYSRPCEIDKLSQIAKQHNLKLMFDSAHAFGCSYEGKMIGNFGDCEVFSFHATKFFNSFEGGAIATNDDQLAEKIRLMQNFGFAGMDNVTYIGSNGKMTEVCAAMGLTNLESLDSFVTVNRKNFEAYQKGLTDVPGIRLIRIDSSEQCNWQYVVIEVGDEYPLERDELLEKFHQRGILVRRYFWPGCHKMEPYRSLQPNAGLLLPQTEAVAAQILVLPTGTGVTTDDISFIIDFIVHHGKEV